MQQIKEKLLRNKSRNNVEADVGVGADVDDGTGGSK